MSDEVLGLPVSGYRPQAPEAVATVNASKELEEHVLRLIDEIGDDAALAADRRWLAIGRTAIEQGFMAVNRAVFKPERIALPDLDEPVTETGWVLERADSPVAAPLYFTLALGGPAWTADHAEAMRFAREIDASHQAMRLGCPTRVCEHRWD
jgi:hypothetical protein